MLQTILKKPKGFQKGHSAYGGCEKGWFKKGVVPKTCFKKGQIPWNKGLKTGLVPKTAFKKGQHVSPETEFKKENRLEKAPNWKGGISPLHSAIRGLPESILWRKQIFERDNYTCQDCNKRGGELHAHHIEGQEFAKLFSEFLQLYSEYSLIEDKEKLIEFARVYIPFWDLNNGETLCKSCHKLTASYLKRRS